MFQLGDRSRQFEEVAQDRTVRRGEIRRRVRDVDLGDEQDVNRRRRVDVTECEHRIGLRNHRGGYLARHDRAEDAVAHVAILRRRRMRR